MNEGKDEEAAWLVYPLVNSHRTMERSTIFGKSTISYYFDWAIFQFANCKKLPEGKCQPLENRLENPVPIKHIPRNHGDGMGYLDLVATSDCTTTVAKGVS